LACFTGFPPPLWAIYLEWWTEVHLTQEVLLHILLQRHSTGNLFMDWYPRLSSESIRSFQQHWTDIYIKRNSELRGRRKLWMQSCVCVCLCVCVWGGRWPIFEQSTRCCF
jgi:hypothetical protein